MDTKIVYINLESSKDRRDGIEKHLKDIGKSNYERFSAFRGRDVTVIHNQDRNYSDGEYGCLYSHIAALKSQENIMEEYVLILEDDSRFLYDFDMDGLWKMVEDDVDIIQLYTIILNDSVFDEFKKTQKKHTNLKWRSGFYGTQAYVIRTKSIPKITKCIDTKNNILDLRHYTKTLCSDYFIYDSVKTVSLTSPLFYVGNYDSIIHPTHDKNNRKSMLRMIEIEPNDNLKNIITSVKLSHL